MLVPSREALVLYDPRCVVSIFIYCNRFEYAPSLNRQGIIKFLPRDAAEMKQVIVWLTAALVALGLFSININQSSVSKSIKQVTWGGGFDLIKKRDLLRVANELKTTYVGDLVDDLRAAEAIVAYDRDLFTSPDTYCIMLNSTGTYGMCLSSTQQQELVTGATTVVVSSKDAESLLAYSWTVESLREKGAAENREQRLYMYHNSNDSLTNLWGGTEDKKVTTCADIVNQGISDPQVCYFIPQVSLQTTIVTGNDFGTTDYAVASGTVGDYYDYIRVSGLRSDIIDVELKCTLTDEIACSVERFTTGETMYNRGYAPLLAIFQFLLVVCTVMLISRVSDDPNLIRIMQLNVGVLVVFLECMLSSGFSSVHLVLNGQLQAEATFAERLSDRSNVVLILKILLFEVILFGGRLAVVQKVFFIDLWLKPCRIKTAISALPTLLQCFRILLYTVSPEVTKAFISGITGEDATVVLSNGKTCPVETTACVQGSVFQNEMIFWEILFAAINFLALTFFYVKGEKHNVKTIKSKALEIQLGATRSFSKRSNDPVQPKYASHAPICEDTPLGVYGYVHMADGMYANFSNCFLHVYENYGLSSLLHGRALLRLDFNQHDDSAPAEKKAPATN